MTIDLSEFRQPVRAVKCAIKTAIETLDEADTLLAALDAPDITTASIHLWLRKRGEKMAATTVARHRKQDCACYR
jgi:molybdopterin-guanine dinucleotide biosynthesis protein A